MFEGYPGYRPTYSPRFLVLNQFVKPGSVS